MLASNITTAFTLPDKRIVKSLGMVRGITVRSRALGGQIAASFQTLFSGDITILTELCEHARQEAFDIMIQHADALGANAIIAMKYDPNEIMSGVTEVIAYGTAVIVE